MGEDEAAVVLDDDAAAGVAASAPGAASDNITDPGTPAAGMSLRSRHTPSDHSTPVKQRGRKKREFADGIISLPPEKSPKKTKHNELA